MGKLTEASIRKMTCKVLRSELRQKDLDVRGKKAELVKRLLDSIQMVEETAGIPNGSAQQALEGRPSKRRAVVEETSNASADGAKIVTATSGPDLPLAGVSIPLPMNTTDSVRRGHTQGKTASGRFWKNVQTRKKDKRSDSERQRLWRDRMEAKKRFKAMKELEQEIKDRRQEEIQTRRQKMLDKKKRKAEGALRNSRFQMIKGGDKLKKMSKKQLRQVKQMRMNPYLGVVEYVSPWGRGTQRSGRDVKRRRK